MLLLLAGFDGAGSGAWHFLVFLSVLFGHAQRSTHFYIIYAFAFRWFIHSEWTQRDNAAYATHVNKYNKQHQHTHALLRIVLKCIRLCYNIIWHCSCTYSCSGACIGKKSMNEWINEQTNTNGRWKSTKFYILLNGIHSAIESMFKTAKSLWQFYALVKCWKFLNIIDLISM